jgi:phage/plasmid-like protein (TIGR03299 family)
MPANIDSMFSVREVPWHEQGVILDEPPVSVIDALHKSGLDWLVETRPIYIEDLMGIHVEVEQFKAVTRMDTLTPLGIVGNRYTPVQNVDAFKFLDNLIGTDLLFETAGSLGIGQRVWVLTKVPEFITIGGDDIGQYVLFANSHDGKSAVTVMVTPVRVVCQNTLSLALSKQTKNRFNMRHTPNVHLQIEAARDALDMSINYNQQFKVIGDGLANSRLTKNKLGKIIDELWPAESDRAIANRDQARDIIYDLHTSGATVGNSPGTKWSGLNAICEYLDWYRPTRGDSDRFARINFEPTNPKQKAYELIVNS